MLFLSLIAMTATLVTPVSSVVAPSSIIIAGLFPMQGGWSGGVEVRPATELALSRINANTTLTQHESSPYFRRHYVQRRHRSSSSHQFAEQGPF